MTTTNAQKIAAWRIEHPVERITEAILCDLIGTPDLAYVSLVGANLQNAYLRYANLVGVNLWGADLRYADLQNANLAYANLVGATLVDADQ